MTASSGCQASAAVFAEFKVKRILMFACNGMKISLNTSGVSFLLGRENLYNCSKFEHAFK